MRKKEVRISASLLSADFLQLGREIKLLESIGVDSLHFDSMDGSFVPNISFGPLILHTITKNSTTPVNAHLMIKNPGIEACNQFKNAGASSITIHYEAVTHLDMLLRFIKKSGINVGIAINPATAPNVLRYLLDIVDYVLIMTVNPGEGGQIFLENQLPKIQETKKIIEDLSSKAYIMVDGGVNDKNAADIVRAGADELVIGSHLFKGGPEKYMENIEKIRSNLQ